ncbi:MAG: hypothetical protein SGPRY_009650 [Prymnesium sp.]
MLQWPWHWGQWVRNATIYIDGSLLSPSPSHPSSPHQPLDLVAKIEEISKDRIKRMQLTIAEYAHCMHYLQPEASPNGQRSMQAKKGTLGQEADAFEITLREAWRLSYTAERPNLQKGVAEKSVCTPIPYS